MKKALILLLISFTFNAIAQRDNSNRMDSERLKAAKVAFLTEKLNLDVNTAQNFWPIFNEFETARSEMNKKFMKATKEKVGVEFPRRDMSNLTDEQATQLLSLMYERKAEELDMERTYMQKFAEVLSPKQVLTVSQFEVEFRRTLMRRYSEESRSRRNKQGNGN